MSKTCDLKISNIYMLIKISGKYHFRQPMVALRVDSAIMVTKQSKGRVQNSPAPPQILYPPQRPLAKVKTSGYVTGLMASYVVQASVANNKTKEI